MGNAVNSVTNAASNAIGTAGGDSSQNGVSGLVNNAGNFISNPNSQSLGQLGNTKLGQIGNTNLTATDTAALAAGGYLGYSALTAPAGVAAAGGAGAGSAAAGAGAAGAGGLGGWGTAAAVLGGSLVSSVLGSNAATQAANTQADAAIQAANIQAQTTAASIAAQQGMFNTNIANEKPFVVNGQNASNTLADLTGVSSNTSAAGYGSLVGQPTLASLQAGLAPNYAFTLQQGQQALNAQAAATGSLMSGQNLKDITNYNQNAAGSALQQSYNNYVTNQTNTYNRLAGLTTTGQAAAAQTGAASTQTGSNIANTAMAGTTASNNYLTGGAAATAAGTIGSANAISGAVNNGINNYTTLSYLNGLNNGRNGIIANASTPSTTNVPQY
jgi:hypothetical protein